MKNKDYLKYVSSKIQEKDYIVLPDEISNGSVLKINYKGDLEADGFEIGFLVMQKGSEIKEHEHTDNIEKYKCLIGTLSVNGEKTNKNICCIGKTHKIDEVPELTVIKTIKISKKLLEELFGKQKNFV